MLLYGQDILVTRWVSHQIFGHIHAWDEKARAIGVVLDDELIAGIVYHDYRPHQIEMSMAAVDKRWCTRYNIHRLLSYPFSQLQLKRVQATVRADNEGAITLLERLGFKREGLHPCAYDGNADAISYGMLRNQCKWLYYGQISAKSTSTARPSSDSKCASSG